MKYLCRNCNQFIQLDWWENHHGRCKPKTPWGWIIFLFLVLVFCAFAAKAESKPAMTCSIVHENNSLPCKTLADWGDVEWFMWKPWDDHYTFIGRDLEVKIQISPKFYTLIGCNFHGANTAARVWAKAQNDGKVEYLPFREGENPNGEKPKVAIRACIFSIKEPERTKVWEEVIIVGEDVNQYWVMKDGYDKPVNIPKSRIGQCPSRSEYQAEK